MSEKIYLAIIAMSAIGAMMAMERLFLGDIISKSPFIALLIFIALIVYADKISNGVG